VAFLASSRFIAYWAHPVEPQQRPFQRESLQPPCQRSGGLVLAIRGARAIGLNAAKLRLFELARSRLEQSALLKLARDLGCARVEGCAVSVLDLCNAACGARKCERQKTKWLAPSRRHRLQGDIGLNHTCSSESGAVLNCPALDSN
jgi:hypothetical protein